MNLISIISLMHAMHQVQVLQGEIAAAAECILSARRLAGKEIHVKCML